VSAGAVSAASLALQHATVDGNVVEFRPPGSRPFPFPPLPIQTAPDAAALQTGPLSVTGSVIADATAACLPGATAGPSSYTVLTDGTCASPAPGSWSPARGPCWGPSPTTAGRCRHSSPARAAR
jgi:hypothetical protein